MCDMKYILHGITHNHYHVLLSLKRGTVIDREPGGVNLAEKVTNFDMVSNDLHI